MDTTTLTTAQLQDLNLPPGVNPPKSTRAPRSDKGTRRQPEMPPRSAEVLIALLEYGLEGILTDEVEAGTIGARNVERLLGIIPELRRAVEKGASR